MILGQMGYIDCIVFLILLTPQLFIHVGLIDTLHYIVQAAPFLVLQLPVQFIKERCFTPVKAQSPFVRQAPPFEDFVIRCVRYAFATIPPGIGRVFFSKQVALPFLKFRMLRHGYLRSPIYWREVNQSGLCGVWMVADQNKKPDIIVYYCHGGGFSMGSSYFYMEFLLAWIGLLKERGYSNPAVFALEYTLVPVGVYPTQLQQTLAGYKHVTSIIGDSSRICVAGDSAGGTLILSLLLHLASSAAGEKVRPGFAVLVSPWTTLVSSKHRNTASDYLDAERLHLFGQQYAGSNASLDDPLVSPGTCKDAEWWQRAAPLHGFFISSGSEEVLAPEIKDTVALLKKIGVYVEMHEEQGAIHAWPVATLFLSGTKVARQKGLRYITSAMHQCLS